MPKAYWPAEPGPTIVELIDTGSELQVRSTPSGNVLWRGSYTNPVSKRTTKQSATKFAERFGWTLTDLTDKET